MTYSSCLPSQIVFPAFLALIKAIPWVLKCVFRSVTLSKCLPHTLQASAPSSSFPSPVEGWVEGDAGAEPFRELFSSWCLLFPTEGDRCTLGACWLSLTTSLTLWVMKRWRDSEKVDAKQAPHWRHCRPPSSMPPRLCWLMCSRNATFSSEVKPQTAHRNPDSGREDGARAEEEEDRSFFPGLTLSVDSSFCSTFTAPLRLLRAPKLLSCSDELSASSSPLWDIKIQTLVKNTYCLTSCVIGLLLAYHCGFLACSFCAVPQLKVPLQHRSAAEGFLTFSAKPARAHAHAHTHTKLQS